MVLRMAILTAQALVCLMGGCGAKMKGHMAPVFAFIALDTPKPASAQAVQESLVSMRPGTTPIRDLKVDAQSISFATGKYTCIAVLADFPIPWSDLEGPCAVSWMWKDATERMKAHRAHLIVTVQGDGPRTERCLLLTKIMAALAAVHDTAGIYWGDGIVVHEPRFFIETAKTSDAQNLPAMLWIEFRIERNPDSTANVLTTGLDAFDLMEVEVIGTKRGVPEVLGIVVGAAAMMLEGEAFRDGDTIGPDANTPIKTRHAPSVWDRKGKVLRIDM
jgi:hypothetical protein